MNNQPQDESVPPKLSFIEPHAELLDQPRSDQLLYKVMTVENLLRSVEQRYLHFNRVDSYADFPGADALDGCQLPNDQTNNEAVTFAKDPNFTLSDYYDRSRSRTYACCFSLEDTPFIWENYANNNKHGKVCIVFHFGNLRWYLNKVIDPENNWLVDGPTLLKQIFSVNYGIVRYVDRASHRAESSFAVNPIEYTFLKDTQYSAEKELRISLSALGFGHFAKNDGSLVEFTPSLHVGFNFRTAIELGAVQNLICARDCDTKFLFSELIRLNISSILPGDV